MVTSIRLLLAPPVFADDEEKTRVASVLNSLLLALLAAAAVYATLPPIVAAISARRLLIAGWAIVLMLALLFVMRRGYVRLAGAALSASLWFVTTGMVVIAGGVGAPIFGAYALIVLTSGVLLGWRPALGFAGLSALTGLALLGATTGGLLPEPYYVDTSTSAWFTQVVFLLYTTVVICLARRSVDGAMQRMRQELAERRRAEVALKESEERYARLVDAAFEGIGFCEKNILFDVNARLAAMLNYTPDELIGMPTEQLVAPESRDLVRRRVETGYQALYEHLALRKDGSVFPVEVRSRYMQYQGRSIRVTVVRDIGERMAAQHALAQSELRFRDAFHANPTPQILTHAVDGTFQDVNAAYERLTGWPRDELLGKRTTDFPLWVDLDRTALMAEMAATGRIRERPTQARDKAGALHDLLLSIEPVQQGETPCLLCVMIDLTERLAAEQALARSERMFKDLVQSINAVVWEADARTFEFLFVSEQAEKLLGYPCADWLASPTFWADHIHPEDRDDAISYCVRCTEALENHEFEYRMIGADGRIVWLRDFVAVEASGGQPRTLRGVMVDITARKQVEEEVQLLQTASLAISTAADLHAALRVALQLVCEATGWVLGQAWMPRADGAAIECSAAWWCGIPGLEAFRRHSEASALAPGEGLPGRVWQSKQTAWVQDVTQDANFPRSAAAREVGLKGGMAFPVLSEAEVVAVLEFFVIEPRAEDARLVKLVSSMAAQLGTVIQRKRAEEELQRSAARLRSLHAIDLAILAARSPKAIAEAALQRLQHLVAYQWAYVWLFDIAVHEVTILASDVRPASRYQAETPLRLMALSGAESLVEDLRQGQLRVVEDIQTLAPTSVEARTFQGEGIRSYIIIPLLSQGELVGSLLLGMDRPGAFAPDDMDVAQEVASQLAVAIQQARLFAQIRAGRARLQILSRQLVMAQEAERRRIARELHDEIGQALALVKLNIRAVQRHASATDLAPRLEQSLGVIEDALLRVRELALDLRPSILDDLGLVAALRWYVDQQTRLADLEGEVFVETELGDLPAELETVCFRVVQEALANTVRHAQAHQFQVTIKRDGKVVNLIIRDDGRGFDSRAAFARAAQGQSGGLLGMQERVMLCGGQLTIESATQRGTTIRAWIPVSLATPVLVGEKEDAASTTAS